MSYPMSRFNLETLYSYGLKSNSGTKSFGDANGLMMFFKDENLLEGQVSYPQPIYFMSMRGPSQPLFLEKGSLKIKINPDMKFSMVSVSAINEEYKTFIEKYGKYTEGLRPFQNEMDPKITSKHKDLKAYIIKKPNSYVAFWEIVNDLNFYGYSNVYLENLRLFSPAIKKSEPYKKLIEILNKLKITTFPDITFDKDNHLRKSDFAPYKLTFIDYWATTCKPCIEGMPELVKMHENYSKLGVNFISVTDESQTERIAKANKILKDNNISWKNYFDRNDEFVKKLNASGYPFHILVNNEGTILIKKYGELEAIKAEIEKYLQAFGEGN
ncbi:MAG: TlpA family protein disulfide reductase [Cytophagaceae bacterium]|nr:TlpA family protein disulfide reductase [Cytophagaceae bacterium]